MADFDFSGLKANVPQGFKVLLAEINSFNVLHSASKREYRIMFKSKEFWLYAGSRIQQNQFDFVWRCDELRRMLLAIGFIKN